MAHRLLISTSSRLQENQFGTAGFWWPVLFGQEEDATQDCRARLAGRATRVKRGGNPICPCRAFLTCFAFHAPTVSGGLFL